MPRFRQIEMLRLWCAPNYRDKLGVIRRQPTAVPNNGAANNSPRSISRRCMFTTQELLGRQHGCFVGFATDSERRKNAASGGVVGALTDFMLESGIVNAVLASRLDIKEGRLCPVSVLARTTDELKACRNSIYLDFNLGAGGTYKKLIREIETTDHRIAVVGLYCHLTHLHSLLARRGLPRTRLFTIGLFCSHAPERELMTKVLERQGADLSKAVAYHTKTGEGLGDGRLHGRSTVEYADGTALDFPFIEFTAFKNAWFYTPKKCLVCPDQFAEVSDISCGDAWYKEIRYHPHKQTTVVTRTAEARAIVLRMVREGCLELRTVDPATIVRSQRRVAGVEKAALPARVMLARKFGIKLPPFPGRIRIRDVAHSVLMLAAVRASSRPRIMKLITNLPTFVVLGFTLLVKLVEQSLLSNLPKGSGVGGLITGYEPPLDAAAALPARLSPRAAGEAEGQ
jgi:coenzyme F420 hydrogenase subunit beta